MELKTLIAITERIAQEREDYFDSIVSLRKASLPSFETATDTIVARSVILERASKDSRKSIQTLLKFYQIADSQVEYLLRYDVPNPCERIVLKEVSFEGFDELKALVKYYEQLPVNMNNMEVL